MFPKITMHTNQMKSIPLPSICYKRYRFATILHATADNYLLCFVIFAFHFKFPGLFIIRKAVYYKLLTERVTPRQNLIQSVQSTFR